MATRTQKLSRLTGLEFKRDTAYGRLNGIFFNASINNYNGLVNIFAFIKRENFDITEVETFFAQNSNKYKNTKASYDGRALKIIITNYLKLNVETVSNLISDLSLFLYSHGYRSGCAFCEKADRLELIEKGGVIMEACAECAIKLEGQSNELQRERSETGSYGKGAIGALIGGILGIIPWVVIGALGYIAAISGSIMAILSIKGYQLLKGKIGKGMILIIIAVLIIFTYIAVIVSDTIDVYNAYPDDKSEVSVLALFGNELILPFTNGTLYFGDYYLTADTGAMWGNLALGWFFAGLGSFFYLRNIGKMGSGKDLAVKRLNKDVSAPADTEK